MGFPHDHRKTPALVAGLRLSGMVAPMVLEGLHRRRLVRSLRPASPTPTLRPEDIVIMDNLSSHKRAAAQKLTEAAGAELRLLSPCSLDFNSIEMALSNLKALVRKAAE